MNLHKKYQILIVFWLCEWKIVLIRLKPSALHWKICVFLSTFWMAKLKTFPDFSGVLILLPSSIYLFKFNDFTLVSLLLLTLNIFRRFFWRFHCWIWTSKCQMRCFLVFPTKFEDKSLMYWWVVISHQSEQIHAKYSHCGYV